MFKKLVTNLPFSPGLVSQVSFYSKRLRQEEFIRRIGLVFMALTMSVQGIMAISPPQAALAVGPNNILYSGVTSKDDLLNKYLKGSDDNGHNDIRQIFDHYKINETSIRNSTQATLYANSHDGNLRSIGRYKQGFASEIAVSIPGTSTTIFERNLTEWNGGPYKVLQGERTDGTYFAVIMSCGNIVIDSGDKPERPPTHNFNATCDAITGKAEDPDGGTVPIRAWIRVVDEPKTTGGWIDITGKIPYAISDGLKSYENKTRVSVEVKDVDTGAWIQSIVGAEFGPCLDPPPPPPPPIVYWCTSSTTVTSGEEAKAPDGSVVYDNRSDALANAPVNCPAPPEPEPIVYWCTSSTTVTSGEKDRAPDDAVVYDTRSEAVSNAPVNCPAPPEPVAACSSLKWIDTKNDTVVVLKATAHVENTSINAYNYTVADSEGKEIFSETVTSNKSTNQIEIELAEPGVYKVAVSVTTDEETVTSDACVEAVTIQDPVKPVFEVLRNKEASNVTQEIEDANGTDAKPGDTIEYRLITRNTGNVAGEVVIDENMADVLEYSQLTESDGADFHEGTGVLSWGTVKLEPNEQDIRVVRVQINAAIPATPRSSGDLASYDLTLRNVYGDDVININVPCSETGKCVEKVVQNLPNTGPGTTVLFNTALIIISVYFYMWNRQMGRELELVKKEYNYSV